MSKFALGAGCDKVPVDFRLESEINLLFIAIDWPAF
jgi:hypothetical protein